MREKFSRGVEFQSLENVKTQILCYENYIEIYSFHQEAQGVWEKWSFHRKKLTSAWKQTSQRFHLVFNSHRGRSFHLLEKGGRGSEKFLFDLRRFLKLLFFFFFANTYCWQKREKKVFIWLFNLCFTRNFWYSSHMHEELCLYFAVKYFMSEKFLFSHLSGSTRKIRSKHYEIFTESYKLHRKLLHRIEY